MILKFRKKETAEFVLNKLRKQGVDVKLTGTYKLHINGRDIATKLGNVIHEALYRR